MNRYQAIELLRKHAKAKPESYYAEPFMPHEWAIDAVIAAPFWDYVCTAAPDNEPAFPVRGAAAEHQFCGLGQRDYFAAKALPSVLDQVDVMRESERRNAAWLAYQIGDDMMKAGQQ